MNIVEIYKKFPTHDACITHLESVRWGGQPVCPYCKSTNQTPEKGSRRCHCNNCNTSYSVTVATIFHHTHLDLQKWFLAISLVLNAKKGYSARQLSRDISVTKDTAWRILMQIRKAFVEDHALLEGIVEADETYVGGKNKNRHKDKKTDGAQGRSAKNKTPVIGLLQRDGKIRAKKTTDVSSKSLTRFIRENVKEGSTISTDEWAGYNKVSERFTHLVVSHEHGQYHQISRKYLDKYVDEFCFRYNHRNNEDVFALTITNAVRLYS